MHYTRTRPGVVVALDSFELRLASARQRYNTLLRRTQAQRDPPAMLTRALAELATALEELRVAQEQLVEGRVRIEQLQAELGRESEKYWQLFDEMPEAHVVSRPDTTIVEVNQAAAHLLNVSQRFLVGKALSVFVCENRTALLAASARLSSEGGPLDLALKLRPRERAPLSVRARVSAAADGLRWVLRPAATPSDAPSSAGGTL
jgi:PAS domain-containing protein